MPPKWCICGNFSYNKLDGVTKYCKVAILGDKGCGKSTLVEAYRAEAVEQVSCLTLLYVCSTGSTYFDIGSSRVVQHVQPCMYLLPVEVVDGVSMSTTVSAWQGAYLYACVMCSLPIPFDLSALPLSPSLSLPFSVLLPLHAMCHVKLY